MRENNKGYTLQEVLISMAIIGIMAAVIIPKLVGGLNNAQIGINLAKGVELMQAGMATIMQQVLDVSGTPPQNLASIQAEDLFGENLPEGIDAEAFLTNGVDLLDLTGGFIQVQPFEDYDTGAIRTYSNANLNAIMLRNTQAYKFKGTTPVIILQDIPQANIANAGNDDVITRVYIDANATEGPNQIGKDIFLFGLTNCGQLVPAGSEAYNENIYGEVIPLYNVDCANAIGNGYSCAARVVKDGWKINY